MTSPIAPNESAKEVYQQPAEHATKRNEIKQAGSRNIIKLEKSSMLKDPLSSPDDELEDEDDGMSDREDGQGPDGAGNGKTEVMRIESSNKAISDLRDSSAHLKSFDMRVDATVKVQHVPTTPPTALYDPGTIGSSPMLSSPVVSPLAVKKVDKAVGDLLSPTTSGILE